MGDNGFGSSNSCSSVASRLVLTPALLRGAGADGAELLYYLHSWSPASLHSWHVTAGM